jgi:2-polyprenyl-3-methyl-5-hydroxy-6-metoxy-1,4-benzoquinol methylase
MKSSYLDPAFSVQEFLSGYVKDKTVLDLGCVEHTASAEASDFWLHAHLVRTAKSVLGVDILEKDVQELRERGYNIVCADATADSLNQTFDVIVAGELIEHVLNPGGLLTNMLRHLNEDGRLIITTPHPFYLLNSLVPMFSKQSSFWHPDHVAWYEPYVLGGMLRKTGYELEACYYFTRSRKLRKLLRTIHLPCYGFMSQSFVVIAKRAPAS